MKKIKETLIALWMSKEGMEMTEYAIVGALVVAVGAAAFTLLGGNIQTVINTLAGLVAVA